MPAKAGIQIFCQIAELADESTPRLPSPITPPTSNHNLLNDTRFIERGQLFFETVLLVVQLLIVQAQQVQDGGMPVGDADWIFRCVVAKIVGRSVGNPGLDASTRHP